MHIRPGLIFSALALASAAGCASGGGGEMEQPFDPNAPIACVDIDNRQGAGAMERIYLVESNRREGGSVSGGFATLTRPGEGVRVGDAPVGRVTRWCSQSIVMPGRYFLRVERPSSDNIDPARRQNQAQALETQDIVIEAGDLWTWDVRRERFSCAPNAATGGGDC